MNNITWNAVLFQVIEQALWKHLKNILWSGKTFTKNLFFINSNLLKYFWRSYEFNSLYFEKKFDRTSIGRTYKALMNLDTGNLGITEKALSSHGCYNGPRISKTSYKIDFNHS